MRWSLYFGPSRPRLCPVAPGSLSEQKASRTQLIFLHLRPAQTDTFCESMQTAKTFQLSIFLRGQLISRRRCVDIQAVCFRLQDNIQTDTAFYCISIQCLIFFPGRKGDRDEMDLADCLEQSLFDFWNGTLATHLLMSNGSSCCGQPSPSALHSGYWSSHTKLFLSIERDVADTLWRALRILYATKKPWSNQIWPKLSFMSHICCYGL